MNKDDILVVVNDIGIYTNEEEDWYKKVNTSFHSSGKFNEVNNHKTFEKLKELSKEFLTKYLDECLDRLNSCVVDVLNNGLQKFESWEDFIVNILKDVMFFYNKLDEDFNVENFIQRNYLKCVERRSWKYNALPYGYDLEVEEFSENFLEGVMSMCCDLKELIKDKEKINLFN